MTTPPVGFGIVGTGMIAGVVADALAKAKNADLTAVSSRRLENAESFVSERAGATPVEGVAELLKRSDVQTVYVATPTVAKEEIALSAIAAGKHVLVDKPFLNEASVTRMTAAAAAKGLVFMDATHFVHHPRTAAIQAATTEKIGSPRSLHTAFYFPFSDRGNIRFDRTQEPMTALGDMAWYSMRAVVEYLPPTGTIKTATIAPERDPQTDAIVRASGLIAFTSGEVSTFDIGYTAGTILMDLQLLGTTGVITLDDFVLDWTNSWSFQNPDLPCGYSYRTGMATRKDAVFIPTPTTTPQEVAMVEDFADLMSSGNTTKKAEYATATRLTQKYLDGLWQSAST